MSENATVPYGGAHRVINATRNHPDVTKAIADQKAHSGKAIAEHAKLTRHKNSKGVRSLKHTITEDVHKDGLDEKQKVTVTTKRRNH